MPSSGSLSMNCTPFTTCPHSNARSSPLSNTIAASSFIELDIDVNKSNLNINSNCKLENEYLNDRPNRNVRFSFRTLYSIKKWPKKEKFEGGLQCEKKIGCS